MSLIKDPKNALAVGIIICLLTLAVWLGFKLPIAESCDAALSYSHPWLPGAVAVCAMLLCPYLAYLFIRTNDGVPEFLFAIFSLYAFMILAFALAFSQYGIHDTFESMKQTTADSDFTNYLYFSTVTFTTLGYGDFRPCESARLLAAVESLLGGFIMPFSSAALFLSKFLKDNSPAPATQAKRHLVETVDDDFVC